MTPNLIKNDQIAGVLLLSWPDGVQQSLDHSLLRQSCRCAFCQAERLAGRQPEAIKGIGIRTLGDQGYGLQIVFSDGHDRGIYPWAYLRSLTA